MKTILKQYQSVAVKNLTEKIYTFISNNDNKKQTVIFQAPTGSGKTIMMSSVINDLINKNKSVDNKEDFTFIWLSIGKGDLHNQSKRSLEKSFNGYPTVQSIDEIFGTSQYELYKDTVLVVNWEKIRSKDGKTQEWKNIVMKDGENINFREMLDNTLNSKRKIILIIDESHLSLNAERGNEIIDLIKPNVVVEVSATPVFKIDQSNMFELDKFFYAEKVNPQDVIDEEMIKDQIIVNEDFVIDSKKKKDSDEIILETAINKRNQLAKMYKEEKIDINPLCLIQIPNSENGEVVMSMVTNYLKNNLGIKEGDERLAIWLDVKDQNLENISKNNSKQEYLIFKQAIDTGWDCPRAQILLKFRESKSEVFNIQVIGRILRMPEQKHYDIEELNKAYIYTNNSEASFDIEHYSPKILGDQPAKRSPFYNPIKLTSFYRERADYQDIKADFKQVLLKQFETELSLSLDHNKNIQKLKKEGWEFDVNNIQHSVIKNLSVEMKDIDNYENVFGKEGQHQYLNINERQVEFISKGIFKSLMGPFTNIARSVPSMNIAWYLTCRTLLGDLLTTEGMLNSQEFLILNKEKIEPIFIRAVKKYSEVREKKAKEDTEHFLPDFEIIEKDYFNSEFYEKLNYKKSLMEPCWLEINRSKPEQEFEKEIERSKEINWWYKNGVNRRDYFGIKYIYKDETLTFYPDYLVEMNDGRIGIFETKHEDDQDAETKTKAKAEALYNYIQKENKDRKKNKLFGGIVIKKDKEWQINNEKQYDQKNGWIKLII